MWSSLQAVIEWVASELSIDAATYPQAGATMPFAVVNRVSGPCSYPHDQPRYGVQFWTNSDAESESLAYDLCVALPSITDADDRINAVGVPDVTQLGHIEDGGFVWQVTFDLSTNIYQPERG